GPHRSRRQRSQPHSVWTGTEDRPPGPTSRGHSRGTARGWCPEPPPCTRAARSREPASAGTNPRPRRAPCTQTPPLPLQQIPETLLHLSVGVDRAVCEGAVQVIDETLDTLAERIYLGLVGLQLVLCSVDQHLVIRLHLVIQKRHLVHGHETLIFVQHPLHHAG